MKERSGMPYDVVAYEGDECARLLDPWEEGVFHRMMRLAWMNGSVPADIQQLADLCRVRPSSLRKSWPKLAPLWYEEMGRLRNKKQENERFFLESKRESARESAKLSWKSKKRKKKTSANAMPSQSERIASLPSPSLSTTVDREKKNTYGEFENVYLSEKEIVKLEMKFGAGDMKARIENLSRGIASKDYKYKSHYATILNWDRKNGNGGNGNGQHQYESKTQGIERRNKENLQRVLSALREPAGNGNGAGDQHGTVGAVPISTVGPQRKTD